MEVNVKVKDAYEVWEFIKGFNKRYFLKYRSLNTYNYKNFLPKDDRIYKLFEDEEFFEKNRTDSLSIEEENFYKGIIKEIYENDKNDLNVCVDIFKKNQDVLLTQYFYKLKHFCINNALIFPDALDIEIFYGGTFGSYNISTNPVKIVMGKYNKSKTTPIHELVHICIEKEIISKYNVPQLLKERIVDIICNSVLRVKNYRMQDRGDIFVDKYVTSKSLEEGILSEAVERMMKDYNKIQAEMLKKKGAER